MNVVTESDNVGYAASYDGDANIVIKHVRVVWRPQTMVTQRQGLYFPWALVAVRQHC